ncbi:MULTISPECIES: hypothetical protein [unclassified Stenotrophomonas]|jgi:hypothetical protein|uniref:hypothetical protein n=1 Tax=unclassified Stenotrophomonas TaxID=196198 RepID=UPI00089DEE41|nr:MULTISPECIES: hypothetical protein [unclassified Stenotrophomonas]AOX62105.1 hypothetical protein BIZ42_07720 [Stenotrophomonas sp. LM091]
MKILGVVLMASALVMTGSAAATNAAPARTEALAREADAFFKDQQPGGVVLVTDPLEGSRTLPDPAGLPCSAPT